MTTDQVPIYARAYDLTDRLGSFFVPESELGTEYYSVFLKLTSIADFTVCIISGKTGANIKVSIRDVYNTSFREHVIGRLEMIEPFMLTRDFDMSGTRIVSDCPVAVFSIGERGNDPAPLLTSMPPVSALGYAESHTLPHRCSCDAEVTNVYIYVSGPKAMAGGCIVDYINASAFDITVGNLDPIMRWQCRLAVLPNTTSTYEVCGGNSTGNTTPGPKDESNEAPGRIITVIAAVAVLGGLTSIPAGRYLKKNQRKRSRVASSLT
ncbi:hypothetical protein ScPMuIL_002598 [Solemya velum]